MWVLSTIVLTNLLFNMISMLGIDNDITTTALFSFFYVVGPILLKATDKNIMVLTGAERLKLVSNSDTQTQFNITNGCFRWLLVTTAVYASSGLRRLKKA